MTDRETLPSKAKRGQYKDHEKEKDECFPHDGMVEFSTGPMELKVVAGVDHQEGQEGCKGPQQEGGQELRQERRLWRKGIWGWLIWGERKMFLAV